MANTVSPDDIETHLRAIFDLLRRNRQYQEAAMLAKHVLKQDPVSVFAWLEYAASSRRLGNFDLAVYCCRHAATLSPRNPLPRLLLGHCLLSQAHHHDASDRTFFDDVNIWDVAIDRVFIQEAFNTAKDLSELGHFAEALACYHFVLQLQPDEVNALYYCATSYLSIGDFASARALLLRWDEISSKRWNLPLWRGENIEGKTLYVYSEQGLGDRLQFVRFLPLVAKRCARVIYSEYPSLWRIIGPMEGVEMSLDVPPNFDVICSGYMLPHLVGIDPETVPNQVPYLRVEADLVAKWAQRLPQTGFRIGIAWQGNPGPLDRGRSPPLALFAPLTRLPGVQLISLQTGLGAEQIEHRPDGMELITLGPDFDSGPDSFVDSAAVMENLDLIITSDNAVAHLAGALGHPVWTMLKSVPDWRWMTEREDCPWYPTMRLFRQKNAGDWQEVMERIIQELAPMIRPL